MLPALFVVVNNIVIRSGNIQGEQYCARLLKALNNVGSKRLFNPGMLVAHKLLLCKNQTGYKAYDRKLGSCGST